MRYTVSAPCVGILIAFSTLSVQTVPSRTPEQLKASYDAHQGDFDYLLGDWEFTSTSHQYGKNHGYWNAVRFAESAQILEEVAPLCVRRLCCSCPTPDLSSVGVSRLDWVARFRYQPPPSYDKTRSECRARASGPLTSGLLRFRPQQHARHDREDGGRGPRANRHREDRREHEGRLAAPAAQRQSRAFMLLARPRLKIWARPVSLRRIGHDTHKEVIVATPQLAVQISAIVPTLTVDDLQKSISFYEALGFAIDDRWEDNGTLLGVMMRAGKTQIGLNQDDWKKGRDRQKGIGVRVSISTPTAGNVDELARRARNAGIALKSEPHDTEWQSRAFEMSDPSGYLLTIFSETSA